jgi:hypothetical protein
LIFGVFIFLWQSCRDQHVSRKQDFLTSIVRHRLADG